MRYLIFIVLLLGGLFQTASAQDKAKIKAGAIISTNALTKSDFATVADHTYSKLLAQLGGRQAFIKMMNTDMDAIKKQGISMERITVGEPGEIVTLGKEMICVVPETITVKMQSRYITSTAPILAVSSDKGKTWYFIATDSTSPQKLKEFFPEYNGKPAIPPPSKPIFSDKAP